MLILRNLGWLVESLIRLVRRRLLGRGNIVYWLGGLVGGRLRHSHCGELLELHCDAVQLLLEISDAGCNICANLSVGLSEVGESDRVCFESYAKVCNHVVVRGGFRHGEVPVSHGSRRSFRFLVKVVAVLL